MKNRLFLGSLSAMTLSSFFQSTKAESFAKPSKPSKAWTGCYELICCKAPWRSVLEETDCLTMPCKAWTGCCLFIKESCHTVASFFDSRGCFLAQNACAEATNSSAARRPGEAFLKKRTVWRSMAEPELGMFCHQRIMCHCCHASDSSFRFLLSGGIFFCFTATISRHKYK